MPASTAASTAATSPRTITMYLPEQMVRASSKSTSAAFSMASLATKPEVMLLNSIIPMEFFAIFASLSDNFDPFRRHSAYFPVDTGVYVRAQVRRVHPAHNLPRLHPLSDRHRRHGRTPRVLAQPDAHGGGP